MTIRNRNFYKLVKVNIGTANLPLGAKINRGTFLSNTPDSGFCVDFLEQALQAYGTPEIFNIDQGCQFISEAFTGVLKAHGIAISMDGRGRALDNIFLERLWRNVKHEDVYLKGYARHLR